MFESMKKKVDISISNDIETIIGRSTVITGQISGGGNIRVDGRVDGGISVSGDAVLGESGCVNGDVKASSLIVAGSVTGNADVEGNLSIYVTGQLVGDVKVRSLNIADGGVFQGRSEMAARMSGLPESQPAM